MLKKVRNQAFKLIGLQVIVVVFIAVLFWIFGSWHAGWSSFLGGLAGVIPSCYFVWKFFANQKRQPMQIVKDFFVGEMVKIILGAVFLVLLVKFLPVLLLPLLIGYIGAYFAIWLIPLIGVK
jgi:F0F1-type ATP synthase assembly protein I